MKAPLSAAVLTLLSLTALSTLVQAATNYTDADILQFALNLECLEAEYYSWGAYGVGIASVDSKLVGNNSALTATSSEGAARPSSGTSWSQADIDIVTEIAENEISHVRYLRAALSAAGATPVPCPQLSLSPTTFTAAASAAVTAAGSSLKAGTVYSPYTSAEGFILGAFIFEDAGVTAYHGAVGALQSQTYAAVAAGIMAIEAGHAAVIRNLLYQLTPDASGLFDDSNNAISIGTVVSGITKLRDNLAGTAAENALTRNTVSVNGVAPTPGPDLFAADSNAVAFARTPSQILDIVMFSPSSGNLTKGGFLPDGPTGNNDVLQITGNSTRTCSGALSMASVSVVSVAALAAAVALAM